MKEWIEEILLEFASCESYEETSKGFRNAVDKILELNDWLEYPKHKPSEANQYIVQTEGNNCEIAEFSAIESEFTFTDDIYHDGDVIAFKPIPVEPYVEPKNKYVEVLEELITKHWDMSARTTGECQILQELKAKIENGDLK